eukprot:415315_1
MSCTAVAEDFALYLDTLSQEIVDHLGIVTSLVKSNTTKYDIHFEDESTPDIQWQPIQTKRFANFINALQNYYHRMENTHFTNHSLARTNKDDLNDELMGERDPLQCKCLHLVDCITFPIPSRITLYGAHKKLFVFYVLQYCYIWGHSPSDKHIQTEMLPKIRAYFAGT